ncbi:unnamed protein product [Oppiella nova]|uniref:Uncharacterized protein n=1 Tax=Oppiella nova TaxID=334625 RepID=A0A7R9QKN5_9ACAR|nr:unnamed protein product [Oppiella nova]CAG2167201.1 unnamed protein product [Oppiella nova]
MDQTNILNLKQLEMLTNQVSLELGVLTLLDPFGVVNETVTMVDDYCKHVAVSSHHKWCYSQPVNARIFCTIKLYANYDNA